jgi:hypothetical protein
MLTHGRRSNRGGFVLALACAAGVAAAFNPCFAQEPAPSPEAPPAAAAAAAPEKPSGEWTALETRIIKCVPYVKATVGETEAWFMFDSGAHTCFDETWARAHIAEITAEPPGKAELVGHTRVRRATVVAGGESFEVKDSVCHDLRPFAHSFKSSFAGLIGADFMKTRTCRIRYFEGPLGGPGVELAHLEHPPVLPPGTLRLPLLDWDTRPIVTAIAWQGTTEPVGVTVMIDTGHAGMSDISAVCASRMKVAVDPGPIAHSMGAYGQFDGHWTRDFSLDFGALQAREIDAFVESKGDWDAVILGGRVLSLYQLVLDIPHRTISLTPNAPNIGLGFSTSFMVPFLRPIALDPSEKPRAWDVYVGDVTWGGPAFIAGLRKGDLLRAINGEDIVDMKVQGLTKFLGAARKSGEEFSVRVRRGSKMVDIKMPRREPCKDRPRVKEE